MKYDFWICLSYIAIGICIGVIAVISIQMGIRHYTFGKGIQGLHFNNNNSDEITARNTASYFNGGYGDWVCVNLNRISYTKMVEVCKHEVGHELFANFCEKNETKCLEAIQ